MRGGRTWPSRPRLIVSSGGRAVALPVQVPRRRATRRRLGPWPCAARAPPRGHTRGLTRGAPGDDLRSESFRAARYLPLPPVTPLPPPPGHTRAPSLLLFVVLPWAINSLSVCFSARARDVAPCSACALSAAQIRSVAECRGPEVEACAGGGGGAGGGPGVRTAGAARSKGAWSCLLMMLWAEANAAVGHFGRTCLAGPPARATPRRRSGYVVWHGEDGYGLRGAASRERLERALAAALGLPVARVAAGFGDVNGTQQAPRQPPVPRRRRRLGAAAGSGQAAALMESSSLSGAAGGEYLPRSGPQWALFLEDVAAWGASQVASDQRRRRLAYGKWRTSDLDADMARCCAEAASPGAMAAFGYEGSTSEAFSHASPGLS